MMKHNLKLKAAKRTIIATLLMLAITIATNFSALAQPWDPQPMPDWPTDPTTGPPLPYDCGSIVPPDYPDIPFKRGNEGQMVTMENNGCKIKFFFCYRAIPLSGTDTLYDFYIADMYFDSATCPPGAIPFDLDQYRTAMQAAMGYVVTYYNPWQIPNVNNSIGGIPPCSEGWSPTFWRAGHPSCMSDYYWKWIDGNLYYGTRDCSTGSIGTTCWNTFKYCYEIQPDESRKLITNETSTGAPSSSVCPSIILPGNNQFVNCNAVCE